MSGNESEFARALGELTGEIRATNKANDEKFTVLFQQIKEVKEKVEKTNSKVTVLEFDKKLVTKIASVVSFFASALTTGVIYIGTRLVTAHFIGK